MRDYMQKTRQLASCIITLSIDTASQRYALVFGMQEGKKRYRITRAEAKTLEEVLPSRIVKNKTLASSCLHAA